MADYHVAIGLQLERRGKILVAAREEDAPQVDFLVQRAKCNGVQAEVIHSKTLKELEPKARSASGTALLVSSTAVMQPLIGEVRSLGVELRCTVQLFELQSERRKLALKDNQTIEYGHAINACELHADKVTHLFGVDQRSTLLPITGVYWKLDPAAGLQINRQNYPVPDLRVPYLGMGAATITDDSTYLESTAVPAFEREICRGIQGVTAGDLGRISRILVKQYLKGADGFRRLAWQEGRRYFKPWFAEAAQAILLRLRPERLIPTTKVGIRAQMLDRQTSRLVTHFLVERGFAPTHILNAISPAWTSAFPFARHVCDNLIERTN